MTSTDRYDNVTATESGPRERLLAFATVLERPLRFNWLRASFGRCEKHTQARLNEIIHPTDTRLPKFCLESCIPHRTFIYPQNPTWCQKKKLHPSVFVSVNVCNVSQTVCRDSWELDHERKTPVQHHDATHDFKGWLKR